jgi:predicted RNA binding protein YcfA (HicA-like mRNA interferase family)
MPKLPVVSGKEVIKALLKVGWTQARTKGDHVSLTKQGSIYTISVPLHDEISKGLLRKILKETEISVETFIELL